ncbi:MAG: DNA polymerase III subunit [Gallionellaceae bacterium]|nr:MAG: DNA polymerase III subunit [Gallionellaceae bacterium]
MKELYPWQQETWQSLQGLRNRLPHALLVKGAQGIGKLDLALSFAQSLLCEAPLASGMPCCQCDSCHWFEQGSHPDFRLVQPDALSNIDEGKDSTKKPSREISVDQIRALANFANLSAHRGGYRIVLVHPAESMNNNSANALLKTLEEPTEKLLFLLVTHKPQQLLPTILSRCLSLSVSTPDREAGIAWLKQQGVNNPENALAQSGFAPLLALHWAEEGEGTEEIGILLSAIQRPAQMDALMLADKLQRSAPVQVVHCLQQWCYDLASAKLTGQVRYFPEQMDVLKQLSANIPSMRLLRYQKELQVAKREAFHPLNPKLQFESTLLSYRQIFSQTGA